MSRSFRIRPASAPLAGTVAVPGDKSIGHRSLLFAALGEGRSEITGLSGGEDNRRTWAAMQALGAELTESGGVVRVRGVGVDGLTRPANVLDCGNSGTSIRLLSGLLAGQRFDSRLDGDESLRRRPMRRVADPLALMGGAIDGPAGPKSDEIYPPLSITAARLTGVEYHSPIASAQVKSAVLLAGLYADGTTAVVEPKRSRDHTERMLASLGVPIAVEGTRVELDAGSWDRRLPGSTYAVPGDPSSAAFICVAALLAGADPVRLESVCANPTRTGFIDVLDQMGAPLAVERSSSAGEIDASITIAAANPTPLRAVRIGGGVVVRAIDELPILAVAAAVADGVTTIADANELRVKESDRIATTAAMLRAFGVSVSERPDGMEIEGTAGAPLAAAEVDAAGDHRIAMAAAVAGLAASGDVVVRDVSNVATSFPTFVEVLSSLGADISVM